jgi:ribosomal protein S18 acetylase RimI-like enzyme
VAEVRRAGTADVEAMANFLDQGWKTHYRDILDPDFLDSLEVEQRFAAMQDNFASGSSRAFMLVDESGLIGVCVFGDSELDLFPGDGAIQALYLLDGLLGKGLGSQLLELAEAELMNEGRTHICLLVFAENHRAVNFYKYHGYEQVTGDLSTAGLPDSPSAAAADASPDAAQCCGQPGSHSTRRGRRFPYYAMRKEIAPVAHWAE